MTRLRSPLFSLGAHGTLGDTLTIRRHRSTAIAEVKPIPSDPQTFLQLYQRWLYKDAMYYWTTLSAAQKTVYKALGNQTNNTTIGAFLKEYLLDPADIVALYRMDGLSAGKVLDAYGHNHPATNFGSSDAPGIFGRSRDFDGVNDYLKIDAHADFELPGPLTLEFVFNIRSAAAGKFGQYFDTGGPLGYLVQNHGNPRLLFQALVAGVDRRCYTPADSITLDAWHYAAAFYDKVALQITLDYTDYVGHAAVGDIDLTSTPSYIGSLVGAGWSALDGRLDLVILWNRALSQAQRRYHAQRYGIPQT